MAVVSIDKQLVSALDRIHRDVSRQVCRWQYDNMKDTYSCQHMIVTGRQLVDEVNRVNGW